MASVGTGEAKMATFFQISYRTGGTVNGRWHPVLDFFGDAETASAKAAEIERMGYLTAVARISTAQIARFYERLREAASDMVD